MATLVDHQIRELIEESELVEPTLPELLNPSSVDVRLHDRILVERCQGNPQVPSTWSATNLIWDTVSLADGPYALKPGELVLASTLESFKLPSNVEGQFCLKSSLGRRGLDHALSVYIDAGFTGQITLELTNSSRYTSFELSAGMRIGQIRFALMNGTPEKPYSQTGRYNFQSGPTLPR